MLRETKQDIPQVQGMIFDFFSDMFVKKTSLINGRLVLQLNILYPSIPIISLKNILS